MKEKVQWKKVWRGVTSLFALAFALWLLTAGLSNVSYAASAAKVTAKAANIRAEANASSTAVGSVKENDQIEILGQTVGGDGKVWYQIYVNGTSTGYIRSDLVEITDGSTPPNLEGGNTAATPDPSQGNPAENVEAEQVTPVGGKVSGSNTVRVRTSPSTANTNNVLTSITNGTDVTVVARTTGADNMVWYQIKFTADNQEAIGYIRSDYVTLSGELVPVSEVQVTQPEEPEQPSEPTLPEEPEETKRYETKFMRDKWYLLDYEAGQQYEIDVLFSTADQYQKLYAEEQSKARSMRIWLIVLVIFTFVFLGCAVYLIYRLKEYKESAFIASIERNTLSGRARTAERAERAGSDGSKSSGGRPVIREGMGGQRAEGQRVQGQKTAGTQGGQRPAGPQGQRPSGAQGGQRPAGTQGQRPSGAQGGQRPAGPQSQRPSGAQSGQRPVNVQSQRPAGVQGVQKPVNVQGQRPAGAQGAQKPAGPQSGQRPVNVQGQRRAESQEGQRPSRPQGSASAENRGKSVNFMNSEDDVDFEVLNWDSDEV